MLFNSFVFLVLFLPVTYTVFWLLRNAQQRYIWLALTGYVFYGFWNPKFCLLMAFSTLVSFSAGLGFLKAAETRNERLRRLCLILPICIDLSLLFFFKYFNFALESFDKIASSLFSVQLHSPRIDVIL